MGLEAYRELDSVLFSHYETHWGGDLDRIVTLLEADVQKREEMIKAEIHRAERVVSDAGISTDGIEAILFVGNSVSNGHAFQHEDRIIVWLPLEAYVSAEQVKAFVPHEILHGIHYTHQQSLACTFEGGRKDTITQFLVEGFAMFFVRQLFHLSEKEALWADHLSEEAFQNWKVGCSRSSVSRAILSGDDHVFFTSRELFPGREGYLLALDWAQSLFGGLSLREALQIKPRELKMKAEMWLKEKAAAPRVERP